MIVSVGSFENEVLYRGCSVVPHQQPCVESNPRKNNNKLTTACLEKGQSTRLEKVVGIHWESCVDTRKDGDDEVTRHLYRLGTRIWTITHRRVGIRLLDSFHDHAVIAIVKAFTYEQVRRTVNQIRDVSMDRVLAEIQR